MTVDILLGLAPVLAYIVSGSLKFALHSFRCRRLAFDQIGSGSFPSTHTAVLSAPLTLVALINGTSTPEFGLGLALLFIVIIDAMDLRRNVGFQAKAVNVLLRERSMRTVTPIKALRERTGHSLLEVAGGLFLGSLCGFSIHQIVGIS